MTVKSPYLGPLLLIFLSFMCFSAYAQKVVVIDGNELSITRKDIEPSVNKIVSASRNNKAALSRNDVIELAREFRLLSKTNTNPHLRFLDGDISYWYEQGLSRDELELQFAAREVVLTTADEQDVIIKDQGTLSWAAQQIMADILREKKRQLK